ncbi:MAG: SOS response-associated peptidase [Chromatiaceae bacterium]|jgi:putative SOS response-associated peptidase YedK|nr:SOS response-associated peptidase [Chromatiaceae bacterium]
MCGRFVQYSDPEVYASAFGVAAPCEARPRYNLAPTQPVLAVRQAGNGTRELVPLRWGLVPAWSKGPDSRYSMINARAETVDTKPAYRNAFRRRRCLIPSEGFYEWKAEGGKKTPYLVRRTDGAPFGLAGLWETWTGADGEPLQSCTVIVTDANDLVRTLHERMPVVLAREDYDAWLDPNTTDLDHLKGLLRPALPDGWTLVAVSRKVNSPSNDSPDLIEPVATA